MTLSGQLITLSTPTEQDYPGFKALLNDQETMAVLVKFFQKTVWSDEDVLARYQKFAEYDRAGRGRSWAILARDDRRVIGNCGFKNIDSNTKQAEFGMIIHKSVWGKGHALEAHLLALNYGFDVLKLQRVYFNTDGENFRMQKFFEKCGITISKKTQDGYLQYELLQKNWDDVSNKIKSLVEN